MASLKWVLIVGPEMGEAQGMSHLLQVRGYFRVHAVEASRLARVIYQPKWSVLLVDFACRAAVAEAKRMRPDLPVVLVGGPICVLAHLAESWFTYPVDRAGLLERVRTLAWRKTGPKAKPVLPEDVDVAEFVA